jgi:hypothetical protein
LQRPLDERPRSTAVPRRVGTARVQTTLTVRVRSGGSTL